MTATTSASRTASAIDAAARAAGVDERLGLVGVQVVADDVVAGVLQVDGHGAAHDAESDEGDGGHVVLLDGRSAWSWCGGQAARRSRGSQPKLSGVVAVVGLYSRPTHPAYPRRGEGAEVALEVEVARAGLAAAGCVGDLHVGGAVDVVAMAASRSSPLAARW